MLSKHRKFCLNLFLNKKSAVFFYVHRSGAFGGGGGFFLIFQTLSPETPDLYRTRAEIEQEDMTP